MSNWRKLFDPRQQQEIAFSEEYAKNFRHGTDGHNAKLIVAQMASIFDGAMLVEYDWEKIAASAFRAYSANRSGKDVRGGNIPDWDAVSAEVKIAWQVAVRQTMLVYLGGAAAAGGEDQWAGWTPSKA